MRAIILCLFLAACAAGPERSELHRGVLAPPPPAPARPGVGLPTYEPQVRPLPPQPQPKPARLLPQTPETRREPGIWASDPSAPWRGTEPIAFGVTLPYLGEDLGPYEATVHRETVQRCAFIINEVGAMSVVGFDLWTLDAVDRACFVARMNEHCMAADSTQVDRLETHGQLLGDVFREILRKTRALAMGFARAACWPRESAAIKQAIASATRAWSTYDRRGNVDH